MTDIEYIEEQSNKSRQLGHATNLIAKSRSANNNDKQKTALPDICKKYRQYLSKNIDLVGYTDEIIQQRVHSLNQYYNYLHSNKYDNLFSAQAKFRPSILEEFIYLLFRDYISDQKDKYDQSGVINSGSIKAYSNLFFKAENFEQFVKAPQIGVNTKDQDYAIYRKCKLTIGLQTTSICIPAVAVEAKTYIDKTMLDSIIATAEKLKTGNPYVRFIAIAEHYDVGTDVDPAYSRIDQIYILRKCRRREWKDIDADVVVKIFNEARTHIERPWSNIGKRLVEDGVIL
ncbi:Bpu10I family restriction endonuclease [uncultured Alistipes sp.]|uniref:Bpu10I family restriction endonuclease n=1 Tax=uncultured Alistipes sp. TaxID=538949 RepID=UPI002613C15E|nr:Bpu10I family restriction endonuclease [uncultured Alistipes sp.]